MAQQEAMGLTEFFEKFVRKKRAGNICTRSAGVTDSYARNAA